MDIVTIQCPNCGAPVERKQGAYFGKCPYCGVEVGFDEMKEEVQLSAMQNRINFLERQDQTDAAHRKALDKWLRGRNIMFAVMAVLHFVGFLIFGGASNSVTPDESSQGIGMLFIIVAWGILIFGTIITASTFPGYNSPTAAGKKPSKIGMWVKLLLVGVALCAISLIAAAIIYAR